MKEWYLSATPPNITSGYESDAIADYAQSNFNDIMETTFSDTVTLCNYDLSKQTEIQCVIQNNTADTRLKTMERQILCPIGTLKAGMYVLYHGSYWIVSGRPDNNKSYEKSTLDLCQYQIRWQNAKGEIIDRWCNITSSSKYGNGESGNNVIILTDDSLTLLLPNDDESLLLGDIDESNERRVFIDKKVIPTKVYKITREDDVLYDYGESGGILSFIAKKTEFNQTEDNQELRVCNYISPTTPLQPTEPTNPDDENSNQIVLCLKPISCTEQTVKCGGSYRSFKCGFIDKDGVDAADIGTWTINCDFADNLTTTIYDNQIKIKVSDEHADLIGNTFELVFSDIDNTVSTKIIVTIIEYT